MSLFVDDFLKESSEDFDDKMVGFIGRFLGAEDGGKNYTTVGLILMAAAGIFLTLGNVLVQFVYEKNASISSFEILFIRSFIQLIFSLLFMISGKVHVFGDKKWNLVMLFAMGISEVAAIIFFYLALQQIPVADATVIQFTAPIFTLLFSFFLLRKQGCGIVEAVCGIVSFIGVIIIAKPDLIFTHHMHVSATHQQNVLVSHHQNETILENFFSNTNYITGSTFGVLAAMCLSLFFILNKMNGAKLDVTLTVFYPSLLGIVVAPVAMAVKGEKILVTEIQGEYWGVIITVGFVSFIGMMFMGEALQLEDAGPAVLIRNCDVIYAYILQYILMHHRPSLSALIGTIIVLTASSILAISRAYELRKNCGINCMGRYKQIDSVDTKEEEQNFLLSDSGEDENFSKNF